MFRFSGQEKCPFKSCKKKKVKSKAIKAKKGKFEIKIKNYYKQRERT